MVRYRFTDSKVKDLAGSSKQENRYDAETTVKVPVNDMVKAVVKLDVVGKLRADENTTLVSANANPTVAVEEAYFVFEKDGYVVKAGKQGLPGPLTDGLNGTGIVATATPLKSVPVTVAGAFMNGSDVGYNDIYAVAAIGSFQGVTAQAWLGEVRGLSQAYSVSAEGTVGPVSLGLGYAAKKTDSKADNDKFSTLKVTADAKVSMFDVHAGYAQTGKEGNAALDGANGAKVNDFGGEQIDLETSNLKLFNVGASVTPLTGLTLGLDYYGGKVEDDKSSEILGKASYSMSKNFKVSTFFSHLRGENDYQSNKGRLEVKYTF